MQQKKANPLNFEAITIRFEVFFDELVLPPEVYPTQIYGSCDFAY